MSINLLPEELKPKKTTIGTSKKLRKAAIMFTSVFVVVALLAGGMVLMLSNLISISAKNQDNIKNQLIAQKQTETRLVLIKDRLNKITQIEEGNEKSKIIELLKSLIENSGDVRISEIEVGNKGILISIAFSESSQVKTFLINANSNPNLKNIYMDTVNYSTVNGYELKLLI